jgi:glycosyltransferase involved in cell wall biosynthesis
MQILIATPKQKYKTQGNHVTAFRWARLIEEAGHDVKIKAVPTFDEVVQADPDVLIALHATHNASTIVRAAKLFPQLATVVIMTGTDLNIDLAKDPSDTRFRQAFDSLESATRIVLLEPASLELLRKVDPRFADKAVVIPQSASAACPSKDEIGALPDVFLDSRTFKVAVVGHLRAVKDPLAAAEAARLLPDESRVQVIQWGAALEETFAEAAKREMKRNQRYDWIGPVGHQQSQLQLQQCDVMVLSSLFEGGPAVLSEAIVHDVPIIANEITATRGLLGDDYPGFYRNADRQQLADLILKAEQDPSFLKLLSQRCSGLKKRFSECAESEAIENLIITLRRSS